MVPCREFLGAGWACPPGTMRQRNVFAPATVARRPRHRFKPTRRAFSRGHAHPTVHHRQPKKGATQGASHLIKGVWLACPRGTMRQRNVFAPATVARRPRHRFKPTRRAFSRGHAHPTVHHRQPKKGAPQGASHLITGVGWACPRGTMRQRNVFAPATVARRPRHRFKPTRRAFSRGHAHPRCATAKQKKGAPQGASHLIAGVGWACPRGTMRQRNVFAPATVARRPRHRFNPTRRVFSRGHAPRCATAKQKKRRPAGRLSFDHSVDQTAISASRPRPALRLRLVASRTRPALRRSVAAGVPVRFPAPSRSSEQARSRACS
jgi:hypothetical protein